MTIQDEIAGFLAAAAKTPELWDAFTVRIVAVRGGDRWLAISSLCRLHLRGDRELAPVSFLPSTSRIVATDETLPIEALEDYLFDVVRGQRRVGAATIEFVRGLARPSINSEAGEQPRPEPFTSATFSVSSQMFAPSIAQPLANTHHLQFSGETSRHVLQWAASTESLDNELRGLDPPWDGLTHLVRGSGASLVAWLPDQSLTFDVIAPLGVALVTDRCALRPDRMHVSLCASTREAIRLSSIGIGGEDCRGQPINYSVNTGGVKWEKAEDLWFFESNVPLNDAKTAAVFLRLKGSTIQRIALDAKDRKPNLLRASHALQNTKNDAEWLNLLLNTRASDAPEFEHAIARLFGMLGLPVDFLGDEKDKDAVDALIRLGRDHLILLECTTSTLKGNGKLARLVSRAARLREGLRASAIEVNHQYRAPIDEARMHLTGRKVFADVTVVPVILSSIPFDEISKGEVQDAQTDGVVVMSRDDVRYFLQLLEHDGDYSSAIADIITGRIQFTMT